MSWFKATLERSDNPHKDYQVLQLQPVSPVAVESKRMSYLRLQNAKNPKEILIADQELPNWEDPSATILVVTFEVDYMPTWVEQAIKEGRCYANTR